MTTALTGSIAAKLLKLAVGDYNFWGESESDSPLAIKRTKGIVDEKKILSLDASSRKKAQPDPTGYKPPTRTVTTKTLQEVFAPLVKNAADNLGVEKALGAGAIEALLIPAEELEYYVQLYSFFKQLDNPKVCYVEDTSDPYTGMFILGESSDGETVFAQTLLTQT